MTDIAAQIGHNRAPSDLEILKQRLDADPGHQKIIKRRDDLLGAVERAPLKIETLDQAKRISELRSYITACRQAAEDAHEREKKPFWVAGKLVDSYFLAGIVKGLVEADATLEPRERAFKLAIAEAERKRLWEEAAARQREADLRALAAVTEADIDKAIAVEAEAKSIADAATLAKPSDLGARITNDIGKTSGLRPIWHWKLKVEGDISKVPLAYLQVNEEMMKARIKARPKDQPPQEINGIEFFVEYKA